MYNMIPLFLGVMMLLLGLFMVINPKASTKAELRDDENEVAKIKRNGFIVVACGVIMLIIGILRIV